MLIDDRIIIENKTWLFTELECTLDEGWHKTNGQQTEGIKTPLSGSVFHIRKNELLIYKWTSRKTFVY